jgi:hypothetical protein
MVEGVRGDFFMVVVVVAVSIVGYGYGGTVVVMVDGIM